MIGKADVGCSVPNRKRRGEASDSGRCVGSRKAAQEGRGGGGRRSAEFWWEMPAGSIGNTYLQPAELLAALSHTAKRARGARLRLGCMQLRRNGMIGCFARKGHGLFLVSIMRA